MTDQCEKHQPVVPINLANHISLNKEAGDDSLNGQRSCNIGCCSNNRGKVVGGEFWAAVAIQDMGTHRLRLVIVRREGCIGLVGEDRYLVHYRDGCQYGESR